MQPDNTTEILKQAILLEKRGRSFYRKVAEQTEHNAVKEIFEMMAQEELNHMQTLAEQYKAFQKDNKFAPGTYDKTESSHVASKVLTGEIKEKISAAGFEAAAISAAIAMEERAIEFYSNGASTTTDPEAKALYQWLANWEREHLNMLLGIDKALKEKIWFDNQFWPF